MNDYDEFLAIANQAVNVARDLVLTRPPGTLTAKGDRDMASEVDYAIERRLTAILREATPAIGFLGEEDGETSTPGEFTWALDPIDGTVNFVHGSPLCAVSLALLRNRHPVLGVIDLPFLGIRYSATEGGGAFVGDQRLTVSAAATLADAVISIGDYAVGPNAHQRNSLRLAITSRLAANAQRIRMHGSAAIDLAWLAHGRIDAVIIMSNQPWDIAAGVIIAREAGADVTDRDGTNHTNTSSATIAANPKLLPQILQLINDAAHDL